MIIRCTAIDDEPIALRLLSSYVARFPFLQMVQTFDDAVTGAEFLRNNRIDLLFIDINMPDITGTELVRSLERKPMVIFTSAYKTFAFEGFELEAVDYLLKPIDINRFTKAINKANDYYKYKHAIARDSSKNESLYVYSEYRMIRINFDDIEYIESMADYIKIYTKDVKPVISLMPLKKVLEKLPADQFKRIHRSFVINVDRIRSIQHRKIQLSTIELPISDTYIDDFPIKK